MTPAKRQQIRTEIAHYRGQQAERLAQSCPDQVCFPYTLDGTVRDDGFDVTVLRAYLRTEDADDPTHEARRVLHIHSSGRRRGRTHGE